MKKIMVWVVLALLVCLVPHVFSSSYLTGLLTLIAIYGLAALGLELLMGYGGQISLGNGGFIAIGAYITAIFGNDGSPPLVTLLMVVLVTIVVAIVVGLPILRLEGYYLAIATLGFALLVQALAVSLFNLTGGSSGISIPPLQIFNVTFMEESDYFYLSWAFLGLGFLFARNLAKTRMGRVLNAIQSNEDAASALGINTGMVKLEVFVMSALYASIAGFLLANYLQFVSPDIFGIALSVDLVVISLLGGHGVIYGPILGSLVWITLTETMHALQDYKILMTGLCLIAILLYFPQGLYGLARNCIAKIRQQQPARKEHADGKQVAAGNGLYPSETYPTNKS